MMKPKKGIDKKRILAIDDAAIVLKRITDALEEYYDVVTVNTGSRGFETLQEIRAMEGRADIPVIMLTGVEDKNAVMESIKLGICDYILKPFFPDDLLERIRQVLEPGEETPTLLDKAEES